MTIKSNEYKTFALFHVSILLTYALLVTFNGFPVFEIKKNLDLRKIVATTDFLVHKLFDLRKIFYGLWFDLIKIFFFRNVKKQGVF